MIKIDSTGYHASVASWLNAVKTGLEKATWTMLVDAQTYAKSISPVYSGDFASNWNVSYGAPDTTFVTSKDFFSDSYPEAVTSAWGNGAFNMSGFKLGMTAYLTNAAEHDEPYAWLIEKNQIVFRPVNEGKDRVMGKTFDRLSRNYKNITKAMMV